MSSRQRNHVFFWILYVFFKAYLNYSGENPLNWPLAQALLLTQVCFLSVKIPLVYATFWVADRYLGGRWNLLTVISMVTGLFFVSSYLLFLVNRQFVLPVLWKINVPPAAFTIESLLYNVFTLLFVVGLTLTIHLFRRQTRMEISKSQLEKEKTEAELKYLKGQLNPHFLFNTLNNIYSLARRGDSVRTADSVMKLSSLMRFMLYETPAASISLREEIRIIEDYIELEKLRYNERLRVHFVKEIDNPEQPIAPLLLIHFVENAFKHGAGESMADVDIRITLKLKGTVFTAEISNPVGQQSVSDERVQIGMGNIRRQLDLLYPGHTLTVRVTDEEYHVLLVISLPPQP